MLSWRQRRVPAVSESTILTNSRVIFPGVLEHPPFKKCVLPLQPLQALSWPHLDRQSTSAHYVQLSLAEMEKAMTFMFGNEWDIMSRPRMMSGRDNLPTLFRNKTFEVPVLTGESVGESGSLALGLGAEALALMMECEAAIFPLIVTERALGILRIIRGRQIP